MSKNLSKEEKIEMDVTEIGKKIKNQLRKEYPDCKFSVRTDSYTGGRSVKISLMEAPFKVIRDFDEISDLAKKEYDSERVRKAQNSNYHQLGRVSKEFEQDVWNNGVFLTEKGHNLFKRAKEIASQYNYDNSNPRTDYYNVNFSLELEIGKHNKPFSRID